MNQAWHRVGLASEFPEIDESSSIPGCKAFSIRPGFAAAPVDLEQPGDLKEQVLVFKYKGKVHAIDHRCPHSSFPLSQGSLFDIEDFGITLSAGITCPKHGWSFDLFSGAGDRGNYRLKVWEVQLREEEVWVRKKQRIG
ncbi:hypothetical protein ASPZODRAFT_99074 [Penicilliopsis zonata CBS 506.65]|uniref:Rieske domain-containing protein n=1 Tax=Penicilliopsis zonata CBS 506.65 TaxID=1073090 RepID=A0A1L9SDK4_9EURO|nr:hypothetical protein ASPZODRAFT_99074 [Penicilliopsis zonata CBS 506.65]OJJ45222.1 hypothetical protein ASPZODRAFT_99074 [Penicilliopsis zonata CBS 506.65]